MSGPQKKSFAPKPGQRSKQDILIDETHRTRKGVWMLATMILLEWDYTRPEPWAKLEKLCRLGFLTGEDILNVVPVDVIVAHAPEFFKPVVDSLKDD